MKITVVMIAASVLCAGAVDILRQKQKRFVLDEIVRLVMYVRSEIHYRSPDLENLFESASKQNYSFLTFREYSVLCSGACDKAVKKEFEEFIGRLGTTDADGQLSLCDEYSSRFSERLEEIKLTEKNRIQTSAALSVLGSVCVIILFF